MFKKTKLKPVKDFDAAWQLFQAIKVETIY